MQSLNLAVVYITSFRHIK